MLFLFILTRSIGGYSQYFIVSGYVRDKNSGETLPVANILAEGKIKSGTTTNQYGFYSISLPAGTAKITASYTGYQPRLVEINRNMDTAIIFELERTTLKGVEIIATSSKPAADAIGRINIPVAQMKEMPVLMGETDILKLLAMSPGVSSGNEGTAGIFVRGGSPDQNLILLDGATVYNTSHLFGFLSVFNADAVKSVELIKGGFPARYGGRLSSIIDVTMKEGNNQKKETSFSISPVSAHFTTEGPVYKGKSSYLVSGRSAYLGLMLLPSWFNFRTHKIQNYLNYFMYDLNLKFNFSPDLKRKLFVSMYMGFDKLQNRQHENGKILNYPLNWGNHTLSIRYTHIISPALFSNTQFNYNYHRFGFSFFEQSDVQKIINPVNVNILASVRDFSIKQQFDWNLSTKHTFSTGIETVYQLFRPDHIKVKNIPGLNDSVLADKNNKIFSLTLATYITECYHLTQQFEFELGMRTAMYIIKNKTFLFGEPRLGVVMNHTNRSAFKFAFSRMTQPVHLLSVGSTGLPNDVWLPSTVKLKPEKAWQVSLGHHWYIKDKMNLTNEIFYKQLSDCIDYAEGSNFIATLSKSWEYNIATGGKGKVYGYELSFGKTTANYHLQLAYTLLWNFRQFKNINHGNWYPYKFDRRHDVSISSCLNLNANWKIAANWVYTTGQAVTLPVAWIEDISGEQVPVYTSRNQQRMPAYHRLDVAFLNQYKTKKRHDATFAVGVYNAYARRNPFAIEIFRSAISTGSGTSQQSGLTTIVEQHSLIGFMPYVSYSLKIR